MPIENEQQGGASTSEVLKSTSFSSSSDSKELGHPCEFTCSGYKQGYEKGLLAGEELLEKLNDAKAKLDVADMDNCALTVQLAEMKNEVESWKNTHRLDTVRIRDLEAALERIKVEAEKSRHLSVAVIKEILHEALSADSERK